MKEYLKKMLNKLERYAIYAEVTCSDFKNLMHGVDRLKTFTGATTYTVCVWGKTLLNKVIKGKVQQVDGAEGNN